MLINIFVETLIRLIFQNSLINSKLKRTAFICNISVFSVTCDQFNASLLTKKKVSLTPNLWTIVQIFYCCIYSNYIYIGNKVIPTFCSCWTRNIDLYCIYIFIFRYEMTCSFSTSSVDRDTLPVWIQCDSGVWRSLEYVVSFAVTLLALQSVCGTLILQVLLELNWLFYSLNITWSPWTCSLNHHWPDICVY